MKERKKEKNSAKGITPVKPSARDNGRCNATNPALIPATIPCAAASSYPVVPNTKSYGDKTSSRATENLYHCFGQQERGPGNGKKKK